MCVVFFLFFIFGRQTHFYYFNMSILESSNSKALLILTDLEPDDIYALDMLFKVKGFDKKTKVMFIVGEGDSEIKQRRMFKYIGIWKLKYYFVLRGYSSSKIFTRDGLDVYTQKELDDMTKTKEDVEYTKRKVLEYMIQFNPFVISLKPPRELIELWNENTKAKLAFASCHFAGYMGFNLRCLFATWTKLQIVKFLNGFQSCYFYETHSAIGSNNNVSNKDYDFSLVPKVVYRVMIDWNKHLAEDFKRKISAYKEGIAKGDIDLVKKKEMESRLHRLEKGLRQVTEPEYEHFVNADTGLIYSLLEKVPQYTRVSVVYNERTGYPSFVENLLSDIRVISPKEGKEQYRQKQVDFFKQHGL